MKTIILFSQFFLLAFALNAATITWIGGTLDWHDASNWNPATVPQFGDHVEIYSGFNVFIYAGNIGKAESVKLFGGANLTINSGGFLKIKDTDLNLSTAALRNEGNLTIHGSLYIKHTTGDFHACLENHDYGTVEISSTGELKIWDHEGNGIEQDDPNTVFTNHGYLLISDLSDQGAHGVFIYEDGGKFYNHGTMDIDLVSSSGIFNVALFNNYGDLTITNTPLPIFNIGEFFNRFHGNIELTDQSYTGITNQAVIDIPNKFINYGTIDIVNGNLGISNTWDAFFINKPAGEINISGTSLGISNGLNSRFHNRGQLFIEDLFDTSINKGIKCIDTSSFINYANGLIDIKNINTGINLSNQVDFDNYGSILIDDGTANGIYCTLNSDFGNFSSGEVFITNCENGIKLTGDYYGTNFGLIDIRDCTEEGIGIYDNGYLSNTGDIYSVDNGIGLFLELGSIVYNFSFLETSGNKEAISIHGTVINNENAQIYLNDECKLFTDGDFLNYGFVYANSADGQSAENLINKGVIEDSFDSGIGSNDNYSYIAKPISNVQVDVPVPNALDKGGSSYNNVVDWYTDKTSGTRAGDYDRSLNEFTPDSNALNLSELYVLIEDITTGFSDYFKVPVTGGVNPIVAPSNYWSTDFRQSSPEDLDFQVFPNPSMGEVNLAIKANYESDLQILLSNSLGQIVKQINIAASDASIVNLLAGDEQFKGMHFVKVISKGRVIYSHPLTLVRD